MLAFCASDWLLTGLGAYAKEVGQGVLIETRKILGYLFVHRSFHQLPLLLLQGHDPVLYSTLNKDAMYFNWLSLTNTVGTADRLLLDKGVLE